MPDGLLLLHAWPLDARMWEPQLAALPPDLAVSAPHLPGFGGSASAGEVTTMGACAERASRALDEASIARAVVCGLSMGGYVAFELLRRSPERIAGLILANTRAVADAPDGVQARRALARRLRSEGNVLVDEPPPLLADDAPDELRGLVRSLIADQSPEAIAAASLGIGDRPDSTPDLAGIRVPTLVIGSTADRLIPVEVTAEMAEKIPQARFETIGGAGHLSNLEAPETFNGLLLEHLAVCGLG